MKTFTKLLLTTAILATGAMANSSGAIAPAEGEQPETTPTVVGTLYKGALMQQGTSFDVPDGYLLNNRGSATSAIVDGHYDLSQSEAIDVLEGGAFNGRGTVGGPVARHWSSGTLGWVAGDDGTFRARATNASGHGFVGKNLTLETGKLIEVIDGEKSNLKRLWRNVDEEDQLTENDTVILEKNPIQGSDFTTVLGNAVTDEEATIGGSVYFATDRMHDDVYQQDGKIVIDLTTDQDTASQYTIKTRMKMPADKADWPEVERVKTGEKTLVLEPRTANEYAQNFEVEGKLVLKNNNSCAGIKNMTLCEHAELDIEATEAVPVVGEWKAEKNSVFIAQSRLEMQPGSKFERITLAMQLIHRLSH